MSGANEIEEQEKILAAKQKEAADLVAKLQAQSSQAKQQAEKAANMGHIKLNRVQKRKRDKQTINNHKQFIKHTERFRQDLLALDPKGEDKLNSLEDSGYARVYNTHQAKFIIMIDRMEEAGRFRFTEDPDRTWFKRMFNPVNGQKITKKPNPKPESKPNQEPAKK